MNSVPSMAYLRHIMEKHFRHQDTKTQKKYEISPQRRGARRENFSFQLPLRVPAGAGCKQRQMKNNQPAAVNKLALINFMEDL